MHLTIARLRRLSRFSLIERRSSKLPIKLDNTWSTGVNGLNLCSIPTTLKLFRKSTRRPKWFRIRRIKKLKGRIIGRQLTNRLINNKNLRRLTRQIRLLWLSRLIMRSIIRYRKRDFLQSLSILTSRRLLNNLLRARKKNWAVALASIYFCRETSSISFWFCKIKMRSTFMLMRHSLNKV
jgi:hypothetical protein